MIPILSTITAPAGTWLEGRVANTKAKAEAEATVLIKQAESAADWEAAMARNSGQSWKDEYKDLYMWWLLEVFHKREWLANE